MCLLLYYLNPDAIHDEYYLILVNVRDEVYDRPTKRTNFWANNSDVIGGIDAQHGKEGGTWFAMSKTGKIAALLNILQPDQDIAANKKGRGFLVTDYVTGDEDCYQYLNKVCAEKDNYNGFTLVTMDISTMRRPKVAFFSNISTQRPEIIDTGEPYFREPEIRAFGNSTSVEHPWPKVERAKMFFEKIVKSHRKVKSQALLLSRLESLLTDRECTSVDENMKMQGESKSDEFMKKLSSIFVTMPEYNYGTRTQTIVIIHGSGKVHYFENNRSPIKKMWKRQTFDFELNCNNEAPH